MSLAVRREAKWRPYPEYRASGVEWLGDVPEHWVVQRARHRCKVNPKSDPPRYGEISFVPMEAVGIGSLDPSETVETQDVSGGYTFFREGDLVVAKITPCFENGKGSLAVGLTNGAAYGTTELHVLRTGPHLDRRFLLYVTLSLPFRSHGEASMKGVAGQQRVTEDFIKDWRQAWPPLTEQQFIAAFLDRETAKIDALVEKKRRLIELLKEKRAALITHAVTKGLDPSVPMKDSGIPWLGQIPAHWHVVPAKALFRERRTPNGPTDVHLTPSQHLGVLPQEEYMRVTGGRVVLNLEGADTMKRVEERDFIIHLRSFQGGIEFSPLSGKVSMAYTVLRPLDKVDGGYFRWLFKSSGYIQALRSTTDQLRDGQSIKFGQFSSISLADVPLDEQRTIAGFLDRETAKFESLIGKLELHIGRLTEYRSALISSAVTGKIDVREVM